MILKRLYLKDFRRYEEVLLDFKPEINQIVGPNAFGKTTILEAVQVLLNGRSFRTSQSFELVRYGQDSFYIEACFTKLNIDQTLKISFNKGEKTIFYNSTPVHSFAGLIGILQGVVTTPDDISLIKGSPLNRRHFLDLQIAQVDPLYVHYLTRYIKAMRQRNALLKAKVLHSIELWENEMAYAASYLVDARKKALHELESLCNPLHQFLTNGPASLSLEYKNTKQVGSLEEIKCAYLHSWQKNRLKEMELGITLSGPHRDDFIIKIEDKSAQIFASEGQKRTIVMALKLAEWQRLSHISGEKPLLLVDDVGAFLDDQRREKLLDKLSSMGQVLLTSTEEILPLVTKS